MSNLSIGIALFGAMLALMAIRVPIAIAMFVPGAIGYTLISGWNPLLNHLKGAVFGRFSVYDLSVIPLFMLMGAFAMHGGLSKALFDFANGLLGRFRGGMAMAGVLACAAFGSMSGSSVAPTATIAQVAYPEMRRIHYSGRLATAALAAGGTLGILLPPFEGALRTLMRGTRLEPGCLDCQLWTNAEEENPGRTAVHYEERWATEGTIEHRVRSEAFTKVLEVLEASAEPPLVEFDFVSRQQGLEYVEEVRRANHL